MKKFAHTPEHYEDFERFGDWTPVARALALTLAFIFLFTLAGCSSSPAPAPEVRGVSALALTNITLASKTTADANALAPWPAPVAGCPAMSWPPPYPSCLSSNNGAQTSPITFTSPATITDFLFVNGSTPIVASDIDFALFEVDIYFNADGGQYSEGDQFTTMTRVSEENPFGGMGDIAAYETVSVADVFTIGGGYISIPVSPGATAAFGQIKESAGIVLGDYSIVLVTQ